MRFNNWKIVLIAVLWVPLLITWIVYCTRKRRGFFSFFAGQQNRKVLSVSNKNLIMKRILLFTALALFTIAAARPMTGGEEINSQASGIDIAVIFDVSLSMYAEDENGARFKKGKMMLVDVLDSLQGDRVAVIPFAGAAFLQMPLTDDYETLKVVASTLEPGMIEKQGTALGTAIELASSTLKSSPETSDKMIIVISDGEDPSLDFGKMRKIVKEQNLHLAILPLGTEDGAPIKIGDSYMKNRRGETVISRIDRGFFEKCSSELGAVEIKKGETVSSYIRNFKKSTRGDSRIVYIYKERFQIPLFFGIVLFFIFQILSFGKRRADYEK